MAWVVLFDGTAGLECAVFPSTYQKLNGASVLREGAFLLARGRLARRDSLMSSFRWAGAVLMSARSPSQSSSAARMCRRHRR